MKRTTGRPKIDPDDDSVQVTVTLPARQYDAFTTAARRDEISVAEAIRRQLDRPRSPGRNDPRR